MKIEVGESLIRSWLRHVEGCQMAELNWKPSPKWEKRPSVYFRNIMDDARDHFNKVAKGDIFKATREASQLLRQGEIDVIGVKLGTSYLKVYAADIAFHENGLNYGGPHDTVKRVLKKMIRSLMIIRSYFDHCTVCLIFASPTVNPAHSTPLEAAFQELTQFLASRDPGCGVRLLVNGAFNREVLTPTIQHADVVADTSELFLRSYQLIKCRAGNVAKIPLVSVVAGPAS